ncbi:hypothetical protein RRG08_055085 [Elysia crispata]|uniref:Uncharacterized protein n=1 Tax=Elysia crispata TaxID=231223 RepID=A0AAE1B0F6_9GAST|nr:hypothetical protein RRG08_055085 [Elysia crispata]
MGSSCLVPDTAERVCVDVSNLLSARPLERKFKMSRSPSIRTLCVCDNNEGPGFREMRSAVIADTRTVLQVTTTRKEESKRRSVRPSTLSSNSCCDKYMYRKRLARLLYPKENRSGYSGIFGSRIFNVLNNKSYELCACKFSAAVPAIPHAPRNVFRCASHDDQDIVLLSRISRLSYHGQQDDMNDLIISCGVHRTRHPLSWKSCREGMREILLTGADNIRQFVCPFLQHQATHAKSKPINLHLRCSLVDMSFLLTLEALKAWWRDCVEFMCGCVAMWLRGAEWMSDGVQPLLFKLFLHFSTSQPNAATGKIQSSQAAVTSGYAYVPFRDEP